MVDVNYFCRNYNCRTPYVGLEHWASILGEIDTFGVEGTGSYGAGLSCFLRAQGHKVIEVNRPDRSTRRRLGKSDPTDAEMTARAVLAGVARNRPKSGVDEVEMIRMLKSTKDSDGGSYPGDQSDEGTDNRAREAQSVL